MGEDRDYYDTFNPDSEVADDTPWWVRALIGIVGAPLFLICLFGGQ